MVRRATPGTNEPVKPPPAPAAAGAANDASITGVIGATGSGKSLWVKAQLRAQKPTRLIVWDHKHEYPMAPPPTLAALLQQLRGERFAVSWRPSGVDATRWKEFDLVCRAVAAAGRCTFVVEELAFVTSPMRAPAGWRALSLTGRHDGLRLIGTSQRPASIDKDFLGNCTTIHCGRVNSLPDVETMARMLAVPRDQVAGLENLQWLERDMTTGRVTTGRIRPPNGNPGLQGRP